MRKLALLSDGRNLRKSQQEVILEVLDGIRLHGLFNASPEPNGQLVILLHGWEGDADSSYMVSSAHHLLDRGYDVFRLHLRDHGPSHALNPDLFNSTLLDEVVAAVAQIKQRYDRSATHLVGFSLGGNFALRTAARMVDHDVQLDRVIAICPVMNPVATMDALCNGGNWLYQKYFKLKWQRSLEKKIEHFPALGYQGVFDKLGDLREMNQYFVPNYTDFKDENSYLRAYAITGAVLDKISAPCHMLLSADDPIIPLADLQHVARPENLSIEVAPYGGHVGFIKNWRLHSWLDERLIELLTEEATKTAKPWRSLRGTKS